MKKIITVLLTICLFATLPSTGLAHKFVGGYEKETQKILSSVEQKLGPINEEITFYNEETKPDGYKRLIELGVVPEIAEKMVKTSSGISMLKKPDKWVVIIRENTLSPFLMDFTICREIIHRYQANNYSVNLLKNRNLIEGEASIAAAKILNANIESEKHQDELDKFNQWKPYNPNKLALGRRYYAQEYCKNNKDMLYYKISHNPKATLK